MEEMFIKNASRILEALIADRTESANKAKISDDVQKMIDVISGIYTDLIPLITSVYDQNHIFIREINQLVNVHMPKIVAIYTNLPDVAASESTAMNALKIILARMKEISLILQNETNRSVDGLNTILGFLRLKYPHL